MKKLLFSRDSECIWQIRELVEKQNHRTLVMWAFDCGARFVEMFEKQYPNEMRPRQAIEVAKNWASGEVKMPVAKKAIHAAHNAASEAEATPAAQAAARAVGHAAATVHVETHALGVVFYGLTALVYEGGMEHYDSIVQNECAYFYDRLLYWQEHIDQITVPWADFLMREDVPNKEKLLREKTKMNGK